MTAARVTRGVYLCATCNKKVPASIKDGRKRVKNVVVDHIEPIIDPTVGFTTWDECIERMFCEADNLQVMCKACHDIKSFEERATAAARRKQEKQEQEQEIL